MYGLSQGVIVLVSKKVVCVLHIACMVQFTCVEHGIVRLEACDSQIHIGNYFLVEYMIKCILKNIMVVKPDSHLWD